MTTKVLTVLQDDLDGSDAAETIRFAIDGTEYEIDLSERNANRFRNTMSEFVSHARRVGSSRRRRGTGGQMDKSQLANIREWAKSHGMKVSERGRISQEVQEAYRAAH
jgi:Lsr2